MNKSAALGTGFGELPVLTRNGDTRPRWRPGERLDDLLEEAATRHASRNAVECDGTSITFAALEAQANRLARLLLDRGFGPGDVLALLFDRSCEAYIALFAVLKINAAYVPLDPAFPADRVRYIVEDASAKAVVTVTRHVGLAASSNVETLCLDALTEERLRHSDTRFEAPAPESELAYVIYTSGSTGRPKGVAIEHASIVHFVRVAAETYGYRAGDRVYQGLTLAFDFSVEEILVPLVAGATLVPSQSGVRLVGEDLQDFLRQNRITAFCCVPTLLATIPGDLPDLRLLIVSGEACPEEIVRRWHREDRTILNAYGPTETTVTATVALLRPGAPVTIGEPLPGYSVVILDPEAPSVLAVGEVGEIGITGIGLSPGYLGRPDLTAKVFVPDFLGMPDNPSGRIYRTGDLGRIAPDGRLECQGRIDTQVKIRGYRIELSEIESVLMQHPSVTQAVVDKHETSPGVVELAAYYSSSAHVSPRELAVQLRHVLPAYMVPAYYEPMPSLPMLACDKVDRKNLPRPSGLRLAAGGAYVAPEGDVEQRLATILGEILQVERVSVADDFFDDLGANSLLMARFSSRIRASFQTDRISMREMYQAPTIRALAGHLRSGPDAHLSPAPTIAPHVATDLAYWGTGVFQLGVLLLYMWGILSFLYAGFGWVLGFEGFWRYLGATAFSAANLVAFTLLPIAAKWLLIGRWRDGDFPVWSLGYAKFWTVKVMMVTSPLAWVPGTPLYNLYLRALGARVAWSAVVQCRPPVCTDLFEVGARTVVGREVFAQCYRAEAGRLFLGRVQIGADCYVGDSAVLDIGTRMEDGSQLAHASSLHQGQVALANVAYQGTPAEATSVSFRSLDGGTVSPRRRIAFSLSQIAGWIFLFGPVPILLVVAAIEIASGDGTGVTAATFSLLDVLMLTAAIFVVGIVLGLADVLTIPRLAWAFLEADRAYPLYGIHFVLFQIVSRTSNVKFFHLLFGDSAYIVHYLRAIGYRFPDMVQTGSNFGVQQRHDVPFLCEFGSGSMVSDSLVIANAEFSAASFRLRHACFGKKNFLGNEIMYPAGGRTGDNVLLGTKTMVPVTGPVHEDTGLLGSPAFAIPRTVQRDRAFDYYKAPDVLAERLALKKRYNLATMGVFLMARYGALALFVLLDYALYFRAGLTSPLGQAIAITGIVPVLIAYLVLVERASTGFTRHEPQYCSIYDRYFWGHERFWKLSIEAPLTMLSGTPFKGLLWRSAGVRVGRKLFDEGCGITEKSLVTIGDHVTLNTRSTIQAHSLEDGTFKSDRVTVGAGTTLGVRAFVHYGTLIGDSSSIAADSFLMKGERVASGGRWTGNPARPSYGPATVERDASRAIAS